MSDSELLTEKRAALAAALEAQAVAKRQVERYEARKPYLDGLQVGPLEVVFAEVREFPWNFHPSPESTAVFYDAIQAYLPVVTLEAFWYHHVAFPISAPTQYGRHREGALLAELKPIFEKDRSQSIALVVGAFETAVGMTNFNVLAPRIMQVLSSVPEPGPGHLAAAAELANDPRWDLLAELAKVPERDLRKKAKVFCDQLEAQLRASWAAESGHEKRFRQAICDYRDGPGRWQELEEVDDELRRLWIGIAGLDEAADRTAVLDHLSDTEMVAGGHSINGMPGYSIGGLEAQIKLIEDNGGVLPSPPEPRKRVAKVKSKTGRRRVRATVTPATLTSDLPLLIRTDFTDDARWAEIRDTAMAERSFIGAEDGMTAQAQVRPLDNPQFDGLDAEQIIELPWPQGGYCFLVDSEAITHPEHPILAVNLSPFEDEGTEFRLTPEAMALVEANLSIGNLGFSDYLDAEPDGIQREM